jgi:hypothetical protein
MTIRAMCVILIATALVVQLAAFGIDMFADGSSTVEAKKRGTRAHIAANGESLGVKKTSAEKEEWNRANARLVLKQSCLQRACLKAGYYYGGYTKKRGLHDDCLSPLKAGHTVSGVSEDAIAACSTSSK